ncbi:MAG: hypothetical protein EBV02_04135 [Actinobacteria bacterium]|nr:hypothetical protein [Actinomycetota bacterium]
MTSPAVMAEVSVMLIVVSVGVTVAVRTAIGSGRLRKKSAISGRLSGRARSNDSVCAPGLLANGLNDCPESLTDPG